MASMKEEHANEKIGPPSFREILNFLRPGLSGERIALLLLGAVLVGGAVFSYLAPLLQRRLIDSLTARNTDAVLLFAVLSMSAVALMKLFDNGEAYLVNTLNSRIGTRLKKHLMRKLLGLPFGYLIRKGGGYLSSRLTVDLDSAGYFYSAGITAGARNFLKLCGGVVFIFYFSWYIGVGLLLLLPFYAFLVASFRQRQYSLGLKISEHQSGAGRVLFDALSHISLVKSRGGEKRTGRRLDAELDHLLALRQKRFRMDGIFRMVMQCIPGVCYGGVLVFGIVMILKGRWTLGELWAVNCYLGYVFVPLSGICSGFILMIQASAAVSRLRTLEALLPEDSGSRAAGVLRGELEFRSVGFHYGDSRRMVLDNFSCRIASGEKVVITGASGSGKSTLAALVLRFYRPSSGVILMDGVPAEEYESSSLRKRIGYLSQNTELFPGTLRENLCSETEREISDGELKNVLAEVGAEGILSRLADGLDTVLYENSANFSVGERLRLAFARELLRDPDLLILDESTANLDDYHEKILLDLIRGKMKRQTVLMISHRESTIRSFDREIRLDGGGQ